MIHLSELRARQIADVIDAYEDEIATANAGKHDTWEAVRDELRRAGLKGQNLSLELAKVKDAVGLRRLARIDPAKAARKEERAGGAEEYFHAITKKPSRTHEGKSTKQHPEPGAGDESAIVAGTRNRPVMDTPEPNLGGAHPVADGPVATEPTVVAEADKAPEGERPSPIDDPLAIPAFLDRRGELAAHA